MVVRVDVYEYGGQFFVEAELPGFAPSDVEILLNEKVLTIRSRREAPQHSGERIFHRRQRSSGDFVHQVALPPGACCEGSRAMLQDGVLTVRIPMKEDPEAEDLRVPVV
jgi:HSP20 family protein